MAVTVNQKKTWEVHVDSKNGNTLEAVSSLDPSAVGNVFNIVARNSGGFIDLTMTPDDFSKWSAFVLARLREEGWRPTR
jgi:hypothetical protein